MVSTFYTPRKLKATEVNPLSNLLSGALDTYQKGLKASYMPRQLEADIFSKNIGPLASIATSPMARYMAPEQQKQILNYISQSLGQMGGGMPTGQSIGGQQGASNEGFALPPSGSTESRSKEAIAGENIINSRFKTLQDAVQKIQNEKGISGLLGRVSLGASGSEAPIAKLFANKDIKNAQTDLEDSLVKYLHYSPEKAHSKVQKGLIQNSKDFLASLAQQQQVAQQEINQGKQTLQHGIQLGGNSQPQQQQISNENQQEEDNADISFALELANKIKKRTGHDVPENLIVNYMHNHPGAINVPDLLKAVGIR